MKGVDRPSPLKEVTIEQRLNSQLPLDATFRDENGKTVPLGKYFGKRPVVLALVYYECPMLCTQILNGMVRAAKVMTFTPGKDYDVVAISFDARERRRSRRREKSDLHEGLRPSGNRERVAFPDRRSGFDQARDGRGGIPVQVGRLYRDLRPCERDLCPDAGGKAFEVFLRH